MKDNTRISVIVPALNEEACIRECLLALRQPGPAVELVVVDGGSRDSTREIAEGLADRVLDSPRGRAVQMNAGAAAASGDILLFVHADCILPPGAYDAVCAALADDTVAAGAFDLRIGHEGAWARIVEWMANWRSRLLRVPYGDQGLFTRKETFEKIGGFRDIPLMEDMEIAGRLKPLGRIVFLDKCILASPRRWVREGVVRTTGRDWAIALAYTVFKVPPERLARHYGDVR
ncbi:MAG: TIGR04283 family arsenosugar biosynthesis glycosyltransferase [Thermodesulfovibrionales bacterium]|nr:TIGR04283 family arsenosugar biosynthesis glycosyltransferase [Thermodesulfovibrionales bacterium]